MATIINFEEFENIKQTSPIFRLEPYCEPATTINEKVETSEIQEGQKYVCRRSRLDDYLKTGKEQK